MLNILSFLILIIITLIRIHSGYSPNPLLSAGTLALAAYLFSLVMRFLRLPVTVGFILAGLIAGEHGLGFVGKQFTEYMTLIESILVMMVISLAVKHMISHQSPGNIIKNCSMGAVAAVLSCTLATGFVAPSAHPVSVKIIFGLFASLVSPLMVFVSTDKQPRRAQLLQAAFGGFVVSVIAWGVATAFMNPHNPDRIKMALMPLIIGLTSTVVGFVWAYVSEKLIHTTSRSLQSLYPLTTMLLMYPFIKIAGLDYIFLAVGTGLYEGCFSDREPCLIEKSALPLLFVFVLFGTRLPIDQMYLLGKTGWTLALIFTLFFLFTRITTFFITARIFSFPRPTLREINYCIPLGPLSLFILTRFLPGFNGVLSGEINLATLYTVCTMSMFITIILSTVLHISFRIGMKKTVQLDE
ncbi:cation:proton antiporter [bacterium]|nr:cation:proton antiporter [bacterium]